MPWALKGATENASSEARDLLGLEDEGGGKTEGGELILTVATSVPSSTGQNRRAWRW